MAEDRAPRLIWTDDGSPRSGRFGDVYFSQQDGLAESRAVFLAGCGLPNAWEGRGRFCVAELGFGTGLNIAALLDLWRREGPADGRLCLFSVEGFPLSRDEAARALAAWPELADATRALLDVWPEGTPGFHRLDLPGFNATLDLAVGDVGWALSQWTGRADAWFLDGFAPSTNPDMWSEAVLDGIRARSAPGARVATFTVAGQVRRGLAERGFTVEKRPGHGRKRERLEARLPEVPVAACPSPSVAVIGAGIAGASLARAFAGLGVRATVIEAERPGTGGSGFPAALVTPRFDAGDGGIAALYAQALRRTALYAAIPDAVVETGVLQLEQTPRDAARFARVAVQPVWAEGAMAVRDAGACTALLGEPVEGGGLWMRDGPGAGELGRGCRGRSCRLGWLCRADELRPAVRSDPRSGRDRRRPYRRGRSAQSGHGRGSSAPTGREDRRGRTGAGPNGCPRHNAGPAAAGGCRAGCRRAVRARGAGLARLLRRAPAGRACRGPGDRSAVAAACGSGGAGRSVTKRYRRTPCATGRQGGRLRFGSSRRLPPCAPSPSPLSAPLRS